MATIKRRAPRPTRLARTKFEVRYVPQHERWGVFVGNMLVDIDSTTRNTAVSVARYLAKDLHRRYKHPTQVIARYKDGVFAFENTYGDDPRRSRG